VYEKKGRHNKTYEKLERNREGSLQSFETIPNPIV